MTICIFDAQTDTITPIWQTLKITLQNQSNTEKSDKTWVTWSKFHCDYHFEFFLNRNGRLILVGLTTILIHINCKTFQCCYILDSVDFSVSHIFVEIFPSTICVSSHYFICNKYKNIEDATSCPWPFTVPLWVGLNHWVRPHQKALPTSAPTWQFGVENGSALASWKLHTGEQNLAVWIK